MNKYKIVIDPGHGGSDFGIVEGGVFEKEYVLNISNYLKMRFDELEIESSMSRINDETLKPLERVERIKNFYGDESNIIILSIHEIKDDGIEIVYSLRNKDTLSHIIANELIKNNQKIKNIYQKRSTIDPSKDYYYIFGETGIKTQPLILKLNFKNVEDNNYLEIEPIVKGIALFTNTPYKEPQAVSKDCYIVQKGDSLYNIARKFNTTVDILRNLNNLNSNLINIGQKLIINDTNDEIKEPVEILPFSEDTLQYVVKKGDSLYSIAKEYNVTISIIKEINRLSTDILSINQILLIPNN